MWPLPPQKLRVMQQQNIVNFAVATSIGMAFFSGLEADQRVREFEELAGACLAILQQLGKPPYLKSVFDTWVTATSALAALERALFPNDPVQTPGHLALPPAWRPLSGVCAADFRVHRPLVIRAKGHLERFRLWFQERYDIYLHSETLTMIDDTLLLFQSIEHLFRLDPVPEPEPLNADSTGGPVAAPNNDAVHRLPPRDPWN